MAEKQHSHTYRKGTWGEEDENGNVLITIMCVCGCGADSIENETDSKLEFAYDGNDLEQIANCSHMRWRWVCV